MNGHDLVELASPIKVLDHGYVKYIDSMGEEESIIEAARMSTGKGFIDWDFVHECTQCGERRAGQRGFSSESTIAKLTNVAVNALNPNELKILELRHPGTICADGLQAHEWKDIAGDKKLLEYLYKNSHLTPFEMCELVIEVQAPIFVFREWHRHRTQSFNEFSARYAQMPNLHYVPELGRFREQSTTNKQASAMSIPLGTASRMRGELLAEQTRVYENYEDLIEEGLAKEVARVNTPVSRYSRMRAKTDLRNWLGFLNLRMRSNAQWEIQQYAQAVSQIIKTIWPRTHALFLEHDLNAVKLSATEKELAWCLASSGHPIEPDSAALVKKLEPS